MAPVAITLAKLQVWPLLEMYFLFLQLHGAQGRWLGSDGDFVQAQLPPCSSTRGGIPGFACYDPPTHPLPPCDSEHQRIGFDCSGWPPASDNMNDGASLRSKRAGHVEAELPPCSSVAGGIPGWDCYDPPTHPLPPCDFKHQRPGFDCWPPARDINHVRASAGQDNLVGAHAGMSKSQSAGHVEEELPPCNTTPGGIPGFDCWPPASN